jgi:hypothetical protein
VGMCFSSYELWRFFVFIFWNFEVFNFSSCHFEGFAWEK